VEAKKAYVKKKNENREEISKFVEIGVTVLNFMKIGEEYTIRIIDLGGNGRPCSQVLVGYFWPFSTQGRHKAWVQRAIVRA